MVELVAQYSDLECFHFGSSLYVKCPEPPSKSGTRPSLRELCRLPGKLKPCSRQCIRLVSLAVVKFTRRLQDEMSSNFKRLTIDPD